MDVKKDGAMKNLDFIKNVDIYLLDQCMKGNINENSRVLDAGAGTGRNFRFLKSQKIEVTGIDSNPDYIQLLQSEFIESKAKIIHSSIEEFLPKKKFDFIICNAVLHFAESNNHFDEIFKKLVTFLELSGTLFIRMTSDIGIENKLENGVDGVFVIPDGSTRYLLTRMKVTELLMRHKLELIEPVKTVNIDSQRCMTTLVVKLMSL